MDAACDLVGALLTLTLVIHADELDAVALAQRVPVEDRARVAEHILAAALGLDESEATVAPAAGGAPLLVAVATAAASLTAALAAAALATIALATAALATSTALTVLVTLTLVVPLALSRLLVVVALALGVFTAVVVATEIVVLAAHLVDA